MAAAPGRLVETFREIYRQHADRVHRQLTRLLGPVSECDDLQQQVFIQLYRALPGFRGESSLGTYLYRIVGNVVCDHRRRQRQSTAELHELTCPSPSPETHAQHRQDVARIFQLLDQVNPKKRVAFVLVTVEGLSYQDAAARVGAKVPATKQRVLAARRELQALLAAAA